MAHIRSFVAAAALVALIALPAISEDASPGTDPARIAAARDLMDVTGITRQMDGMMDAMTKGFAKGANADTSESGKKATEEFQASMAKFMSYKEEMMTDFAALYAETFTAEEMKQVADFYRSGTGAKFIQMTPSLMQKGAQIGMKYAERITREMGKDGAK